MVLGNKGPRAMNPTALVAVFVWLGTLGTELGVFAFQLFKGSDPTSTIISICATIILALVGYIVRDATKQFKKTGEEIKNEIKDLHTKDAKIVKAVYGLSTELHPEKGVLIAKHMSPLINGNGD